MRQRPLPHVSPARQHPQGSHLPIRNPQRRRPGASGDASRSLSPKEHERKAESISSWEIAPATAGSDEVSYDQAEVAQRRLPLHESGSIAGLVRGDGRQKLFENHSDDFQSVSVSDTENDPRALHYPRRLYYQNGEVHFRRTGNRRRTRPEDFHTVYRTPHHVPDRKFKDYLLGRQGSDQQPRASPMVSEESVAQSCFGFSLVAVVFLLWVGLLFDRQPLYIRGSLPVLVVPSSAKGGRLVSRHLLPDATTGSRLLPATVSYHAAIAYMLTAAFCWYRLNRGWVHDKIRRRRRRSRYEDIPDLSNRFAAADAASFDEGASSALPMFHRHGEGVASTTAYQIGAWSRVKASFHQWLAMRGLFYRPAHKFRRKREPKCV